MVENLNFYILIQGRRLFILTTIFFLYLSSLQMDMDIILRLSILKKFCHNIYFSLKNKLDQYRCVCGQMLRKINVYVTLQFVRNIIRFVIASLITNSKFFSFLNAMFGPLMNRFDLHVWL